MKYIDEFDIDLVNQALTFNTTDMHIQGTCDLFTTKPIGTDRKLYKTLDRLYNPNDTGSSNNSINEDNNNNNNNNNSGNSGNSNSHYQNYKEERQNSDASAKSVEHLNSLNPQFMQLKTRSFSYSYSHSLPLQQYLISKEEKQRSQSFNSPPPQTDDYSNGNDKIGDFHSPFGPLSQQSSRRVFAYLIGILNSTYPDHDFSTVQPNNFTLLSSSGDLIAKVNSFLISLGKSTGLDWIWQTINTHMDLDHCICFQYEPEQSFLNDLPGTLWCNMYFIYNKKKKRVAFLYVSGTVLQENNEDVTGMRRKNSKIGTLDEERLNFGDAEGEYDLRYSNDQQNGPSYEDVFDDDDEEMADDHMEYDDPQTAHDEDEDEDDEDDYAMDEDELANENQDDEGFV